MFSIFVINPGSTSTKISLYNGITSAFNGVIRHEPDEIKGYPAAIRQLEYRFSAIKKIYGLNL